MTARARQSRVERGHMKGYHPDLQDFVMRAVNHLGMECRIAKNSLLIYPNDGSTPVTVYDRNSDRQMKALNAWLDDLTSRVDLPGVALGLSEDQSVDLAAANLVTDLVMAAPEFDPVATVQEFALRGLAAQEAVDQVIADQEWTPWMGAKGDSLVEGIEFNGTIWRCVLHEEPVEFTRALSLGGHKRMHHTDTADLHTEEAIEIATWHKRYNRLNERVTEALGILTGEGVADPREVEKLRALNEQLRHQNDRLKARLKKQTEARRDADARLALIKEAWRA